MSPFTSRCAVAALCSILAAACGKVANDSPDAGPADAPVDAPPLPVKVTALTLLSDGAADPTAKVLFQDTDGTVIADVAVNALGQAEAVLPRGGSVSTIRVTTDTPEALSAVVTTMLGVKAGDDLTFGLKAPGTIANQGGSTTMTANFTELPPALAPANYTFFTSCGAASVAPTIGAVTLNFRDSCRGSTFDLIAVASGGALTTPYFLKLTNIAYQGGGTFRIPGGFVPMTTFTVNVGNIADAISNLSLTRAALIDSVAVAGQSTVGVDPPAGSFAATVPFAQAFGTRSQISLSLSRADSSVTQQFEARTATLAQPVAVDLGTLQLPWLTGLAVTATGTTWTTVVPGDTPDGMLTTWIGRWNDGSRPVTVAWRIAQPAELNGAPLPRLPSAYAKYDPGQQTVAVTASVALVSMVDYDKVAGYDEFRRMPETLVAPLASLGAFIGVPFQRRIFNATVRMGVSAAVPGAGR
jgi:hypothetical protein